MFTQDPELMAAFFFVPTYHLCNESSTVIATWWEITMLRLQLVINLIWGYLTASCNKLEISELVVYEKLYELAIWKTLTMGISSGHHWNRFLSCTYYCLYYINTRPASCWDNIYRSTAHLSIFCCRCYFHSKISVWIIAFIEWLYFHAERSPLSSVIKFQKFLVINWFFFCFCPSTKIKNNSAIIELLFFWKMIVSSLKIWVIYLWQQGVNIWNW